MSMSAEVGALIRRRRLVSMASTTLCEALVPAFQSAASRVFIDVKVGLQARVRVVASG